MRIRLVLAPAVAAVSVLSAACSDTYADKGSNVSTAETPSATNGTPTGSNTGVDTSNGGTPSNPQNTPVNGTSGGPSTPPPGPGTVTNGPTPINPPQPNVPGPDPAVPPGPGAGGQSPVPQGGAGPTPQGGSGPSVIPTGSGGTPNGGSVAEGGTPGVGGATGGTSSGGSGSGTRTDRPCDIYGAAGTECVAAYSTVRSLFKDYTGPLYQVRSGSNPENTGSGGETHDIGQTADGFADAAAQDAVCAGTTCTISLMYDHSGRGNDLPVAKRGRSDGGEWADDDDFESIADEGPLTVGGHEVYSLFMDTRQGYRMTRAGDGIPRGQEAQGLYMLADGTHYGTACCWDFGNVTPDPTQYHVMNTLFFGTAFWGRGAGNGPWYMADFEAGVWAGGSQPSDPGWGSLDTNAPPNEQNPSLGVPFAIGFLKTDSDYALRMADLETANSLTTAYEGPLPKAMDNQGAIVIGVGGDNSNNSWGTFFEGAVIAGYPADETEDAVMQNVKAAGYGQ